MITLRGENRETKAVLIRDYAEAIRETDKLPPGLLPVLFGLYGEVGSILAVAKKFDREKRVFLGYHESIREEFGDVFWYFATLCRRLHIDICSLMSNVFKGQRVSSILLATDLNVAGLASVSNPEAPPQDRHVYVALAQSAAELLNVTDGEEANEDKLIAFAESYLYAMKESELSFASVLRYNIEKTNGRFLAPNNADLPTFDLNELRDEQLPIRMLSTRLRMIRLRFLAYRPLSLQLKTSRQMPYQDMPAARALHLERQPLRLATTDKSSRRVHCNDEDRESGSAASSAGRADSVREHSAANRKRGRGRYGYKPVPAHR